jgi:hypothetical protein
MHCLVKGGDGLESAMAKVSVSSASFKTFLSTVDVRVNVWGSYESISGEEALETTII